MAIRIIVVTVILMLSGSLYFLFRHSPYEPMPANSVCLGIGPEDGQLKEDA